MHKLCLAALAGLAIATAPALAQNTDKAETSGTSKVTFYNAQASNQYLASTIIGAPVENRQDEVIGDVNDALIDPNGKVSALIIGVGGFLGVNEKNVAVSIDSVDIKRNENKELVVVVEASKNMLEKTAEFKPADSGPTFSERWNRFQKQVQKQAEAAKKTVQEQAEAARKTVQEQAESARQKMSGDDKKKSQ